VLIFINIIVTTPPNGPVLFCLLASVVIDCKVVLLGAWAAHTAWRASTVTSR